MQLLMDREEELKTVIKAHVQLRETMRLIAKELGLSLTYGRKVDTFKLVGLIREAEIREDKILLNGGV